MRGKFSNENPMRPYDQTDASIKGWGHTAREFVQGGMENGQKRGTVFT